MIKKISKKLLVVLFLIFIPFLALFVYAEISKLSSLLVAYNNSYSNSKVDNVKDALDELYIMAKTNAQHNDLNIENNINIGSSITIDDLEYKVFFNQNGIVKLIAMDTIASTKYGSNQYYANSLVESTISDYANRVGLKYHVRIPTIEEVGLMDASVKAINKPYFIIDAYTSAANYVYYANNTGTVTHCHVNSVYEVRPMIVLYLYSDLTLDDINEETPIGTIIKVQDIEYILFAKDNGIARLVSAVPIGKSDFGSDYYYEGNSIQTLVDNYAISVNLKGKMRLPTSSEVESFDYYVRRMGEQYYTANPYTSAAGYAYGVSSSGVISHLTTSTALNVRTVLTYAYDYLDSVDEITSVTPLGTVVKVGDIDYVIIDKNKDLVNMIAMTCIDSTKFGDEYYYEGNVIENIINVYADKIGMKNKVRIPNTSDLSNKSSYIVDIGRNYWLNNIYECDGCGTSYENYRLSSGSTSHLPVSNILGVRPVITYSYSYLNSLSEITSFTPVGTIVKIGDVDYIVLSINNGMAKLISTLTIASSAFGGDDYYEGNSVESVIRSYAENIKMKNKVFIPSTELLKYSNVYMKNIGMNYWLTNNYTGASGYVYYNVSNTGNSKHTPIASVLGVRPVINYNYLGKKSLSEMTYETEIGTVFTIGDYDYVLFEKNNGVAKLVSMATIGNTIFGSNYYYENSSVESVIESYAEEVNLKGYVTIPSTRDVNLMEPYVRLLGADYWTSTWYSAAGYNYYVSGGGSTTHISDSTLLAARAVVYYAYGNQISYSAVNKSTPLGTLVNIGGTPYIVFSNSEKETKMISLSNIGNSKYGSSETYSTSTVASLINTYATSIGMNGKITIPTTSEISEMSPYMRIIGKNYWTQTNYTSATNYIYIVNTSGEVIHAPIGTIFSIRPVAVKIY